MDFTVKQATVRDLGSGWTGDAANWPIHYKSYTSEDAFCEALKVKATTDTVAAPNGIVAHTLALQPYTKPPSTGSQDRHTVQHWELPSGQWTFVSVFDGAYEAPPTCYHDLRSRRDIGHSGHETSEHAARSLPSVIRSHLESILTDDPDAIGDAFSEAIQVSDKSLEVDLKTALPENFESLSDEELQVVINDRASGGRIYTKVVRCMCSVCPVVAVIDPARGNLWIVHHGEKDRQEISRRLS